MFILYWDAEKKQVFAMNGSGRSGSKCNLETIRKDLGISEGQSGAIPTSSVHAATVPGAAAGWFDTHKRFGSGKVSLAEVLGPAINLGEQGFPVSEVASQSVRPPPLCFRHGSNLKSGVLQSVRFAMPRLTLKKC